mgnify:CR=1 FL=1
MGEYLKKEEKKEKAGIIGQWVGGVIVGIGIGIEISMGCDIGYILISCGSLIYALATKLRKI